MEISLLPKIKERIPNSAYRVINATLEDITPGLSRSPEKASNLRLFLVERVKDCVLAADRKRLSKLGIGIVTSQSLESREETVSLMALQCHIYATSRSYRKRSERYELLINVATNLALLCNSSPNGYYEPQVLRD